MTLQSLLMLSHNVQRRDIMKASTEETQVYTSFTCNWMFVEKLYTLCVSGANL
jgi:hypothetical protein